MDANSIVCQEIVDMLFDEANGVIDVCHQCLRGHMHAAFTGVPQSCAPLALQAIKQRFEQEAEAGGHQTWGLHLWVGEKVVGDDGEEPTVGFEFYADDNETNDRPWSLCGHTLLFDLWKELEDAGIMQVIEEPVMAR
ncbi:MAG TPA: hypothetical protein VIY48_00185 [Candidatus Paceibacterota bacterium]